MITSGRSVMNILGPLPPPPPRGIKSHFYDPPPKQKKRVGHICDPPNYILLIMMPYIVINRPVPAWHPGPVLYCSSCTNAECKIPLISPTLNLSKVYMVYIKLPFCGLKMIIPLPLLLVLNYIDLHFDTTDKL